MVIMILKMYFVLFFAIKCHGFAEEYYDNTEVKITPQVEVKNKIGRRSEQSVSSAGNMTTVNNVSISHDQNEEDIYDGLKFYVMTKKSYTKSTAKSITADVDNVFVNNSLHKYSHTLTATSVLRPIDIFKDYEYIYDAVTPSYLLRVGTTFQNSPLITPNNTNNSNAVNVDKDGKGQFIDFFNLEPAVDIEGINISKDSGKYRKRSDVWYVLERSACWELPVLYGERRPKSTSVFALYSTLLKNVIDMGKPQKNQSDLMDSPYSQLYNKWCSVEPCYGDHTLCLFPYNRISKICDSRYQVLTPTMTEQIALVNTVNSMRNRIAYGETKEYPELPPAANMRQIMYDYDLEKISEAWLRQCLPGPAPCSALDGHYVTSLECTKYADNCCLQSAKNTTPLKCIPRNECFVSPIIGCIYTWFSSAKHMLDKTDVDCGHTEPFTYPTVQLIWADTYKIGCAYGVKNSADIRVVCNFSPGAPFLLEVTNYCGFIKYEDIHVSAENIDITDLGVLSNFGLELKHQTHIKLSYNASHESKNMVYGKSDKRFWDNNKLSQMYDQEQFRVKIGDYTNRTIGMVARLVTKYTFIEESDARCDTDEPIYIVGEPGSQCVEKGRRYQALCYDFRDPTPGYRLIAVLSAITLFSVILYDLFGGVVRQTNY